VLLPCCCHKLLSNACMKVTNEFRTVVCIFTGTSTILDDQQYLLLQIVDSGGAV